MTIHSGGLPPERKLVEEIPGWRSWREALAIVRRPHHFRRTLVTALIVGTILFVINQLNVVAAGHATTFVWLKIGLTYLVPFTVSNVGILIATRRRLPTE